MVDDASALVVIEPAMGIPMAAMVEAGWSMVEAAQPDPSTPHPSNPSSRRYRQLQVLSF
jgi:hypothetical protein